MHHQLYLTCLGHWLSAYESATHYKSLVTSYPILLSARPRCSVYSTCLLRLILVLLVCSPLMKHQLRSLLCFQLHQPVTRCTLVFYLLKHLLSTAPAYQCSLISDLPSAFLHRHSYSSAIQQVVIRFYSLHFFRLYHFVGHRYLTYKT